MRALLQVPSSESADPVLATVAEHPPGVRDDRRHVGDLAARRQPDGLRSVQRRFQALECVLARHLNTSASRS